jgi:hypothetical protein
MSTKLAVAGLMVLALSTGAPNNGFAQSAGAAPPGSTASNGSPQVPQPPDNGVNWSGVGYGAGTVVTNVFYIPAKLVYGILGGFFGGAGYVLTGGNTQVSNTIWRSSLGGDYVVTPDMLRGNTPIHFSGPTQTPPQPSAASLSSQSPQTSAPALASAPPSNVETSSSNPAPVESSSGNSKVTSEPIDNGSGPVGGNKPSAPAPALPATSVK